MPVREGIECRLIIASDVVAEYDDPERPHTSDNDFRKTCYIESTENAEFQVSLSATTLFTLQYPDIAAFVPYVCLDGIRYCAEAIFRTEGSSGLLVIRGIPSDDGRQTKPLRFAKRAITEDTMDAGDTPKLNDLGEIRVELVRYEIQRRLEEHTPRHKHRKKKVGRRQDARCADKAPAVAKWECSGAPAPLHEKMLKGKDLSHMAELGEPEPDSWGQELYGKEIDAPEQPFVAFAFKYRSKHALQVLGLIPRTPSPELPDEEEKIAAMSREDLERELRELNSYGLGLIATDGWPRPRVGAGLRGSAPRTVVAKTDHSARGWPRRD